MDTKGNIDESSEVKLNLFSFYLESYLAVMTSYGKFGINVYDIFAGKGVSNNKKVGSAMRALKIINEFRLKEESKPFNSGKSLGFHVNEVNPRWYEELIKNLDISKNNWVRHSNETADKYIEKINFPRSQRSFIFLDPHGYTQVSNENLNKILKETTAEILMFFPTSAITRFAGANFDKAQLRPVEKFLKNFGLLQSEVENLNPEEFIQKLKEKFGQISKAEFIYHYNIKKASNTYMLIFITHHLKGAVKFLEAESRLIKELAQLKLDLSDHKAEADLSRILREHGTIGNDQLFLEMIKGGHLPKKYRVEIESLEEEGEIIVKPLEGSTRSGNALYLNEKGPRILIKWVGEDV